MTDTALTDDQMIHELESAGVEIKTLIGTGPYPRHEITARWPDSDGVGTFAYTLQDYGRLPVEQLYRQVTAIRAMQTAGYRVLMDQTSNHVFRVRVQKRGTESWQRALVYNQATTSTSGYPIQDAFMKWEKHMQEGGAQ